MIQIQLQADIAAVDTLDQALETARRLGLLQRTKLIVMHVYDAAAAGMLNYAGVDKTSLDDYLVDTRTDAVRDLVRFLEPLQLDELVTRRMRLEDINAGFDAMKRGELVRAVMEMPA